MFLGQRDPPNLLKAFISVSSPTNQCQTKQRLSEVYRTKLPNATALAADCKVAASPKVLCQFAWRQELRASEIDG